MRERLLSGQTWYFEEDGTSVTLDLVVDFWDLGSCRETSQVMIGGLWYKEEEIQRLVAGRRNSVYTMTSSFVDYDRLTQDICSLQQMISRYLRRYQPHEREYDDVLAAVSDMVCAGLLEEGYAQDEMGNILIEDDISICVSALVKSVRDTMKTVHVR